MRIESEIVGNRSRDRFESRWKKHFSLSRSLFRYFARSSIGSLIAHKLESYPIRAKSPRKKERFVRVIRSLLIEPRFEKLSMPRGQDETIINRNKYRRRLPRSRLCAITRLFRKERADGTFSLEFPSNPNAFQSVYIMPSFSRSKNDFFLIIFVSSG